VQEHAVARQDAAGEAAAPRSCTASPAFTRAATSGSSGHGHFLGLQISRKAVIGSVVGSIWSDEKNGEQQA
jgi:hypothetical protein